MTDTAVINILYKPLDVHRDEIRLLVLSPCDEPDKLCCRLIHRALALELTQPEDSIDGIHGYGALSYEWSDPLPTGYEYGQSRAKSQPRSIIVDGKPFSVGWNLYCALRQLILPGKTLVLWVDALCINQKDEQERNQQVAMMKKIYAHANRVVVWLGRNSWPRGNALLRVRDFNNHVLKGVETRECEDQFIIDLHLKYFSIWRGLLVASYWTRLWIIQEIVLAKNLVLHLGDVSVDWEEFQRFCTGIDELCLQNPKWKSLGECGCSDSLPFQLSRRRARRGATETIDSSGEVPLFDQVLIFGTSLCTDIRDRIFGLHSLAPRCCREATPVEYNIPLYHKCAELTHHYILKHYGAGQTAGPENISSVLPAKVRSIQVALDMNSKKSLRSDSLDKQFAPIKVTGNIVGVVSVVASRKHVDELSLVEMHIYRSRSVIKPIYEKEILHALTPEIFRQLRLIKDAKGWRRTIPLFLVPLSPARQLPRLSEIPEETQLPENSQYEQGQGKAWEQKWWNEQLKIPSAEASRSFRFQTRIKIRRKDGYGPENRVIHQYLTSFSQPLSLSEFIAGIISQTSRYCKTFFCANGIIGHTYGDIREGDIICGLEGSRTVLALRKIFDTYYVAAVGCAWFPNTRDRGEDGFLNHPVHFMFSIQALMDLTADWK